MRPRYSRRRVEAPPSAQRTREVAGEVRAADVYPVRWPVTRTVIRWPFLAAVSLSVRFVAREMALPLANQRYVNVVPEVQVPGRTVRVRPTRVVPAILGRGAVSVPAATDLAADLRDVVV